MNAIEIEQAVSDLARQPFNPAEFPYSFLLAFGNKETTISRLRAGATNKSDCGGVLQTNNIHIAAAAPGDVSRVLTTLRASPANVKAKVQFILATDGDTLEAEDLGSGETVACAYADFPDHFGFFLPLAGITTVQQIRESSFDIRATSRLNRLYVELLKDNPAWSSSELRHAMNHFMARLIFCFFAEDTNIFRSPKLFMSTVETMSARDSSNTHEVIGEAFRAMNTKVADRSAAGLPRWTEGFPYVNGGLFSGVIDVPVFSKIARTYLVHIGNLDWTRINPDIFGSMIQAVADDEERGALGMHYTSVPNILKVLNPLFLDELRSRLAEAGDNGRVLLNLRRRMSRIRVFDPACGSGNFLVIAYKEMRSIEAEINTRRNEAGRPSGIPLTNFRGIEIRDFPAEVARLALIIAEFQCDMLYRGQKLALDSFLPLDSQNWITCGNALRLDWLSICPPTGTAVRHQADDLFSAPVDQAEIDFENEGGETYICGNPPYLGSSLQNDSQKSDLGLVFESRVRNWKNLDYVAGWFIKAAAYVTQTLAAFAFVSTNSICQGQQVSTLWSAVQNLGNQVIFAYNSFKWANLASHNAGVTVVIVGVSMNNSRMKKLYSTAVDGSIITKEVDNINAYLVPTKDIFVQPVSKPINGLWPMDYGSKPADGGGLILTFDETKQLKMFDEKCDLILPYIGSTEFIDGKLRYCLWISSKNLNKALENKEITQRIEAVRDFRAKSKKTQTREAKDRSHTFLEIRYGSDSRFTLPTIVPIHTSENRDYLPVGVLSVGSVVSNAAFAIYDAPLWNMALIASRLHLVWIATVCGKIKTDFRYSNTLGWNTFPVPTLTQKNKADLTRCAEDILLAREAHFPATIADLYAPDAMPADLRRAHERNDEVLERIYIGRRFRNDTERLEKLFELYTAMTAGKKDAS